MPIPTTALQCHFDASVNTNLWGFWQSTTPFHNTIAGPPPDDDIQQWEDADGKDMAFQFIDANIPRWQLTTPAMALPNLDFAVSGSYLALQNKAGTAPKAASAVINPLAFLVLMVVRIEGVASNDPLPYLNECLIGDGVVLGRYWGIHLRNNAGVRSLQFYNYCAASGGSNFFDINIALNTDYLLAFWRDSGGIFAEVYNAAGLVGSSSAVSGPADDLTHQILLARSIGNTQFYNGRVGEIAIYNAYNATDKAAGVSFLLSKWGLSGGGPLPPTLNPMTPNSAYANATVPVKLIGVAFTGAGLDGSGGAFNTVAGFTFSNLSIAGGGASGTVDIQIATGKTPGAYSFTYTTGGGSSLGTTGPVTFTVLSPSGGVGDTGSITQFNVGFN